MPVFPTWNFSCVRVAAVTDLVLDEPKVMALGAGGEGKIEGLVNNSARGERERKKRRRKERERERRGGTIWLVNK